MSRQSELAELSRVYDSSPLSNRNLLINGACQVWQRGTSFSGNSAYNADRWYVDNNSGGGGQSTDAPDGFTYSLKIDPSSGDAAPRQAIELPAAGEGGVFRSGQKLTLSFYLKSDNAGEAINIFAASGTTVTATTTAQVNDTSTGLTTTTSWTRYTYTFTSNNVGGSDTCYNIVPYVGSPSGDTYWTGFQLELGDTATPFEHRSYGDELQRCKRYFEAYAPITNDDGSINVWRTRTSVNNYNGIVHFLEKRVQPTCTLDYDRLHKPGVAKDTLSNISVTIGSGQTTSCTVNCTPDNDSSISTSAFLGKNSGTAKLSLDAEL